VLLDSYGASGVASGVSFRATNSGTFLVIATDNSGFFTGSGTYRLKLAKTGSPIVILPTDEGGSMTNGVMHTGTVDIGDMDVWKLTARAGDTIAVRMGEMVPNSTLQPYLLLFGPDGTLLDAYGASGVASGVSFRATNSGTFMVIATDNAAFITGSGTYRVELAKTGSSIVILPTDEGGSLTNGVMHTGMIDIGDLDVWSFTANAGESITVRMGEMVPNSTLQPYLLLYGPDGVLLSSYGSSGVASEVSVRATNSGTFTVIATVIAAFFTGSGTYRLTLAKSGLPIFVSGGDEGGPMTGAGTYDGTLDIGDVDAWQFTACMGDVVSVNVAELVSGSPLTPWIGLYGRDGVLLQSGSAAGTTGFANFVVPSSGTYTVVLKDFSGFFTGSGTYRLTVNGLVDALRLCVPHIAGGSVDVIGIGGVPGTDYRLLTSTDVAAPRAQWTSVQTGQFDQYGTVNYSAVFDPNDRHRFFRLEKP
jgi:hypothetical protein